MQNDNNDTANPELHERIKNTGYLAYNTEPIICTAVFACVLIIVSTIVIHHLIIILGVAISAILLAVAIIILYLYFNKQYFIEYNGINITVIGGFRRFRKYYINNDCYLIANGKVEKTTVKSVTSINLLISEMEKAKCLRKVSGNKEFFQIKQKEDDPITVGLGGGAPLKYGTMTFVNGKFKNGYLVLGNKSIHIHFKVIQENINYNDILPECILNLLNMQ